MCDLSFEKLSAIGLNGFECWPVIKDNERGSAIIQTKILRWTSGITRHNYVRNEDIRDRCADCAKIARRLRLNGHVIRANEN